MTPTKEQRQAAEEALGYVMTKLCTHEGKKCLCGEVDTKVAEGIVAELLASREAAAAYAGAMGVVEAVQEQPGTQPCLDCDHGLCVGFRASIKAAKQAADKLKPKGV